MWNIKMILFSDFGGLGGTGTGSTGLGTANPGTLGGYVFVMYCLAW